MMMSSEGNGSCTMMDGYRPGGRAGCAGLRWPQPIQHVRVASECLLLKE